MPNVAHQWFWFGAHNRLRRIQSPAHKLEQRSSPGAQCRLFDARAMTEYCIHHPGIFISWPRSGLLKSQEVKWPLDLLFPFPLLIHQLDIQDHLGPSDDRHEARFFEFTTTTASSPRSVTFQDFFKRDNVQINRDLEDIDSEAVFEGKGTVDCVKSFDCLLNVLLSKHVPLKSCCSNEYPRWFMAELRHLMCEKIALHGKLKASSQTETWYHLKWWVLNVLDCFVSVIRITYRR